MSTLGAHPSGGQPPSWVCLDIGEVLIDETRVWSTWADVLGLTRFTLLAALGAAIAAGADHRAAFERLGIHGWRDHEPRVQDVYGGFTPEDLYPDALPALAALRSQGLGVAVVGNQPRRREPELSAIGVDADVLVTSETLGVEKPAPQFFSALLARLGGPAPRTVAYVGDRVDNDVEPAAAAGLRPVWLQRGPWGALQSDGNGSAELVVASLSELVERVPALLGVHGQGAS